MASRIGKKEWVILYVVTGTIDVVQWVIDFTVVGAAINEVADTIIGVCIGGYLMLRSVSLIAHWKRLVALVGGDIAEELTASVAPAWIIDIWYIHHDIKREDAEERAAQEQNEFLQGNLQKPLYQDGRRMPFEEETSGDQSIHMDGVRAPGKVYTKPSNVISLRNNDENREELREAA